MNLKLKPKRSHWVVAAGRDNNRADSDASTESYFYQASLLQPRNKTERIFWGNQSSLPLIAIVSLQATFLHEKLTNRWITWRS